jgi:Gpi18-like mannosyltransferase
MMKPAASAPRWSAPGLPATALKAAAALLASSALGALAIVLHGITGTGATTRDFPPFINMWIRWDAGWYQGIAEHGYSFSSTVQSSAAYFPLYPSAIGALVRAGANPFIAGIILTVAFGLAAFCLFWLWAKELSDQAVATLATQLFLLWPFAFFLYGAVYSDALFIALALGAFLCLERGALLPSVVLGALATATRPVGPALVLGLVVRRIELQKQAGARLEIKDLAPLLCAVGMVAYMTFLYVKFGDPLAFLKAQGAWRQEPGWSSLLKLPFLQKVLQKKAYSELLLPALHLTMALGFLALAAPTRKLLGTGYAVYVVAVLAMPLLVSRDFIGLGRYCLAAFPCFLILALRLQDMARARKAWMVTSALLLAVMVSEFAIGHYIS